MNTEGSDVGTRLARDPEDGKVTLIVESVGLGLEDGADSKLTLDGRDQRGALEQSTGEGLEGLAKGKVSTGNGVMESNDTNVAFSSTLLGLDEASRAINAKELMLAMCDHIFLSRLFHSHSRKKIWPLPLRIETYQTVRQPVTLGSRVPLWPVFSTWSMRFTQETTSCEEGLAGLSRLITP